MNCWYCKQPMDEHYDRLSITYLDRMISLRIHQCHYFYCESCDIVCFSEEQKKKIEEVIRKQENTSMFRVINL
jgi:hypothetical protein